MDDWIKWFGGTLTALLTIIFGSRLIESVLRRRWKKQDDLSDLSTVAQNNTLAIGSSAFTLVTNRLKEVEIRLDTLQITQLKLVEENITLKNANEQLVKENIKIVELMAENSELLKEVVELRQEIEELKQIIIELKSKPEELH